MNVASHRRTNVDKITVANPTQTCDDAGKLVYAFALLCVWVAILSAPIRVYAIPHPENEGLIDPELSAPLGSAR